MSKRRRSASRKVETERNSLPSTRNVRTLCSQGMLLLRLPELIGERTTGRSPVPGMMRGWHQPSLPGEPHLDWNSSPASL